MGAVIKMWNLVETNMEKKFACCRYEVVSKTKKCLEEIDRFIKERHPNESGIIYCLSRSDCEKVTEKLRVITFEVIGGHVGLGFCVRCRILAWVF